MRKLFSSLFFLLIFAVPAVAVDATSLKNEFVTDPQALGYATPWATGDNAALVELINRQRAGVPYQQPREPVNPNELMDAIVPTDMASLSTNDLLKLSMVYNIGSVDLRKANIRALLASVFPANSASRTAIQALANRQGSRAEVLYGTGVVVSLDDVRNARLVP